MEQNVIVERRNFFSSLNGLSIWVMWIFVILAILDIVAVISGYAQADLLHRAMNGGIITQSEAAANDTRQAVIGFSQTALFIISGIVFLVWIHRAYKNLTSFNAFGLRFTPGWAVGWFFVPIMSLFRPYEVVSEIWKVSNSGLDEATPLKSTSSSIIGWWWAFFLISNILSQIALRIVLKGETASELLTSTYFYIVSDAIDVVGIIITIIMVKNINQIQEIKNRQVINYEQGVVPITNN
ncbi:MAG: DUF4328 domain-containing protein [Dehalococcoidales bacterium]|nr:DUF4328 domain-containing protein [Dehalococcoidales bacterium]